MSMGFLEKMEETQNKSLEYNSQMTENGALGYKTTGKEILDLNFKIGALRKENDESVIEKMFSKVFFENKMNALLYLFFAGDVRGGLGERRFFRICFRWLSINQPKYAKMLLKFIPEYTRWDNLICLAGTPVEKQVFALIEEQLKEDEKAFAEDKPISLLAKWLPGYKTTNKEKKYFRTKLCTYLDIDNNTYRHRIGRLRRKLELVETKLTEKRYSEIDYSAVPSKANLVYRNAFLKHDKERREAYLENVLNGKEKIHSSVLFPYEIVDKYIYKTWGGYSVNPHDISIESLWINLPDYVKGNGNTICINDGSGSMYSNKATGNTPCAAVSIAITIYFAERCNGPFKDKYITFSSNPKIVSLENADSLHDKVEIALAHNEIDETDIEKAMMLILKTAVDNKMSQEDLPRNILILSDMEFNRSVTDTNERLFESIRDRFETRGYKMPRVIFWNIFGRTNTIPLIENEMGVALISGFSTSNVELVLSNKTDPLEVLLEKLFSERYLPIKKVYESLVEKK